MSAMAQRFTPIVLFDDFHPKSHPSTIPASASTSSPTHYQRQQQQQSHSKWSSSQKSAVSIVTNDRDGRDSGMGMDMDIDMDESKHEQPLPLPPNEESNGYSSSSRHSQDTRIPSEGVDGEEDKADPGSTSPRLSKTASRKTSISSSSTAATQISSSNDDSSSSALVSLPSPYFPITSPSTSVFPKTSSPTTPTDPTLVSVQAHGQNTHKNSNTSTSPSMAGRVVIDMHWKRVQRMLQQNSLLWWELVRYTRDLERKEREQETEKESMTLGNSSTEGSSQTFYHQHHHHHHYHHPMLPPLHPQQQYRQPVQLLSSTQSNQAQQQPLSQGSLSTRRSLPSIRTKIMQNRSHPYEYHSTIGDIGRSSGSTSGEVGGESVGRGDRDQERSDPPHSRSSHPNSVYDRSDYQDTRDSLQSAVAGPGGPMAMDTRARVMAPRSTTSSSSPRSTTSQSRRRSSVSSMNEAEEEGHPPDPYPPHYSGRDHYHAYSGFSSRRGFSDEHALSPSHRSDTPRVGASDNGSGPLGMSKTAGHGSDRTRDSTTMDTMSWKRHIVQPKSVHSTSSPSSLSPPASNQYTVDHKSSPYDPLPSPGTSAGIQSSGPSSVTSSPQSRERSISMMQPSAHSHHYHPNSQYHPARISTNESVHHQWNGSGSGPSQPPSSSSPPSSSKPHFAEHSHPQQHPHHHHHHHHHPHSHVHYLHPNTSSKGLSGRSLNEYPYSPSPLNGAAPVIQRPIPVKPSSTSGPYSLSNITGGRGGHSIDSGVAPEHIRSNNPHGSTIIGGNGVNATSNSNNNNGTASHGTTMTTAAATSSSNTNANTSNNSNGNGSTMDPNRKRRGNLPKSVTSVLKNWLVQNATHPYPTEDEKMQLSAATQLSMNQISNWFINARRRILQPILVEVAAAKNAAAAAAAGESGSGVSGYGKGGSGGTGNAGVEGSAFEKKSTPSVDGVNMVAPENVMIVRKGKGSRMQVEGLGGEPLSASAIANVNATIAAASHSHKEKDRAVAVAAAVAAAGPTPPLSTAASNRRAGDETETESP